MHRVCNRKLWAAPRQPLTVVVTGGSRGLGKALAREFLAAGDRVLLTSRTQAAADAAVRELREEVAALNGCCPQVRKEWLGRKSVGGVGVLLRRGSAGSWACYVVVGAGRGAAGEGSGWLTSTVHVCECIQPCAAPAPMQVVGVAADVSDAVGVAAVEAAALSSFGRVDAWVNNAGYSGSFQPLVEQTDAQIEQVSPPALAAPAPLLPPDLLRSLYVTPAHPHRYHARAT